MSDTETVEPKAANVVEALSRVMRDLPGIGKDSTAAPQQGGYAYRGIEQITVHTQGLFARHGIVFTPHVISYEVRDLVVNGKPWTDVYELVEYTVYGPGGREDCIKVGPLLAIGRDNSDKGANKCLTQAFKYALLQALSISDAKDDGDGQTHEAQLPPPPPEPTDPHLTFISAANVAALVARCTERGVDPTKAVKLGTDGRTDVPAEVFISEIPAVREALDELAETAPAPEPEGTAA